MKKSIAINQPTFLPWIGWFDLLDQTDIFVILDDVQFSKQSWQQRNRIKTEKDYNGTIQGIVSLQQNFLGWDLAVLTPKGKTWCLTFENLSTSLKLLGGRSFYHQYCKYMQI